MLVFDYVRLLTHTPTLISHDSEGEFFPLGHIRQLQQRILFDGCSDVGCRRRVAPAVLWSLPDTNQTPAAAACVLHVLG